MCQTEDSLWAPEAKRKQFKNINLLEFLTQVQGKFNYRYLIFISLRFIGVKGVTTYNTEEVANEVSADKRQCRVEGEVKLTYFPRYSRSACDIECITKKMEKDCKCRPYFLRGSYN